MTLCTFDPVLPLVARLVHGGSEVGFGTYWEVVDQAGKVPFALVISGDENRLMDAQWCRGAADGWNAAAQAIEARRAETVQQGSVEDESAVGNADAPTKEFPHG
jgi:hypothetical protein